MTEFIPFLGAVMLYCNIFALGIPSLIFVIEYMKERFRAVRNR